MTCIVGLADGRSVWIAGDAAAVCESYGFTTRLDPKVFRRGPYVMGFTTSFRMGQILAYRLKPPKPKGDLHAFMATDFVDAVRSAMKDGGYGKTNDGEESCGTFLVGVSGRLFAIYDDFQVSESAIGFAACGCGAPFALGALYAGSTKSAPKKRLQRALEAAETFSAGVGGPFTVLKARQDKEPT